MTTEILSLPDLEAAINYWRTQSPSAGEEWRLCAQASALSRPYAQMIYRGRSEWSIAELDPAAREAWDRYRIAHQEGLR